MSINVAKRGKLKTSPSSIPVIAKGPEPYKDVEWHTLNDDEVKAMEKDNSLAWRVLTNSNMQVLKALPVEELQQQLACTMDLTGHEIMLEDAAILDFYVSGFWWGKEQGWNEQQISGLFTVHNQLLENIKGKNLTLEENLTELRKMLVGIGTKDNQSGGLDFMDLTMATSLLDYLSLTFFQHYRLYEFLFHGQRAEEVISTDLEVELVPPADLPHPAPLDEGLPEDLFLQHLAPTDSESRASVLAADEPNDGLPEDVEVESKQDKADVNDKDEVADILAGVTAEDVQAVFDSVSKEIFATLQDEVALKLKEQESEIISRINKIHRILGT